MKKFLYFICLLALTAGARAQDEGARQDINLSFMGVVQPYVASTGAPVVKQTSTLGKGLYLGYRYLLTPNGALEANYSYSRFTQKFTTQATINGTARIPTSLQEATFAYVRTFPFRRWNPFIEGGGGLVFYSPIGSPKLTTYDTQQVKSLTILFGGGIAYELSPSWDLRVQYRAQVLTPTNFGLPGDQFKIDRRYIMSQPAVGLAYHF